MEATSTDKKSFQLTENGRHLGELIYDSMFSYKAEIRIRNTGTYRIVPKGLFTTSIAVTKNKEEVAHLQMNWSGHIILTFKNGDEFIFKAKGALWNKYVIENKKGETVAALDPKFNWKKFNYNYNIVYEKKPQDIAFVLLCVYAANYFIASMSGMVAGM